MAKKKQYKDWYVKEMQIWLEQHRVRLKSCLTTIAEAEKQIVIFKKLIKLEQAQTKIIRQIIRDGEGKVAKYLKKRKAKN